MDYKMIQLKTGYALIPKEYIIIESTKTPLSDYVAVVYEKSSHNKRYVVFLEKPIYKMAGDERYKIFEDIGAEYSEVMEILLHEVDARYEDGLWVNIKEWTQSPRMFMYAVKERDDGHGIRIVRNKI